MSRQRQQKVDPPSLRIDTLENLTAPMERLLERGEKQQQVEERVLVLETDISRLDSSISELMNLVKDQNSEQHEMWNLAETERKKDRDDVLKRFDDLLAKQKPDWQVIVALATFLVLVVAALWGLAIAPIRSDGARTTEDLKGLDSRVHELRSTLVEHIEQPGHTAALEKHRAIEKDIQDLEEATKEIRQDLSELKIRSARWTPPGPN